MALRAPRRFATMIALPTAVAAGVAVSAPAFLSAPAFAGHEEKYKGSAQALTVRAGLLDNDLLNLDLPAGELLFPAGGGEKLIQLPDALNLAVAGNVLTEETGLNDLKSLVSTAAVTDLSVLSDVVTALVLKAQCTAKDLTVEGDSAVTGLAIAGAEIPIDPGPNFKIELPEIAGLSGAVYIDEHLDLVGGGQQINALRVVMKLDPAGIAPALEAIDKAVRATAEQLKTAVETMTGKSLEDLLAAPRPGTAPVAEREGASGAPTDARTDGRGAATERVQRPATGTQVAAAQADAGGTRAPAAADRTEEVATAETADATEATAAEDRAAGKTDGAALDRSAQRDASATTEGQTTRRADADETARTRVERDAKSAGTKARSSQQAQDAAPVSDSTQAARAQQAAATDRALDAERAERAAEAARAREANTTKGNADGARLSAADRAAAPTEKAAVPEALGLVGLEVIVSKVTCLGAEQPAKVVFKEAKVPKQAPKQAPEQAPEQEPKQLPKTGGNGDLARDLTVAGLGLLAVGSTAIFVSRRRRSGDLHG